MVPEDNKIKQQQIDACKDKDGKIIDVPDYILDLVDEKSNNYFEKNKGDNSRLLEAYGKGAKDFIRENSTHKDTSSQRRQLHKEIILDMARGKKAPENSEQQNIFLFAGPPGAGKSTLRKKFDSNEQIDNPQLEALRQQYKQAAKPESIVSVDFPKIKKMLPEYEDANKEYKSKEGFGDMYGLIRAEAAGINESIQQFAKDVGLTSVREQLMDIDVAKNKQLLEEIKDTNLTVIGVTASPEVSRKRVKERNQPMKDEEVVRAIKTFSTDKAFETLAKTANQAILVNTDNGKNQTVFTAKEGQINVNNRRAMATFRNNENYGHRKSFTEFVQRESGRDLNVENLYSNASMTR